MGKLEVYITVYSFLIFIFLSLLSVYLPVLTPAPIDAAPLYFAGQIVWQGNFSILSRMFLIVSLMGLVLLWRKKNIKDLFKTNPNNE